MFSFKLFRTPKQNQNDKSPSTIPQPNQRARLFKALTEHRRLTSLSFFSEFISFSDAAPKIGEQLELLSLPPSLTADNLDRTLKKLASWPAKITTDDHIRYAQLVIPTLFHYFHAVYAVDTRERRIDSEFLRSAQEQSSFHIISTIRLCVPPAYRPKRDIEEDKTHSWLFYHLRILQTLQVLLASHPTLSIDTATRDTIIIDLSDALVKSALTVAKFPSLISYHPKDVVENLHALRTLEAHVGSLSDDTRAQVTKNMETAKSNTYFPEDDSDAE